MFYSKIKYKGENKQFWFLVVKGIFKIYVKLLQFYNIFVWNWVNFF